MPVLAKKTLALIEETIAKDGGTKYRSLLEKYLPLMADAYRPTGRAFRKHLGVSKIGSPCSRELWYNFRWAKPASFSPRIIRLFNRGHLEEAHFLALLEMIGVTVWEGPEGGGQFKVSGLGGHYGSALDGIARGIPDLPEGTPILLEFKTSADKGFRSMTSKGVQESKPVHYAQIQVCMAAYQLPYCLYLMVNKNDDALYGEIVPLDQSTADRYNKRAELIITSNEPPMKINTSPSWFECTFCDYKKVCHFNEIAARNCRTCIYSSPDLDGKWNCGFTNIEIDIDTQLEGCGSYEYAEIFNFPV